MERDVNDERLKNCCWKSNYNRFNIILWKQNSKKKNPLHLKKKVSSATIQNTYWDK